MLPGAASGVIDWIGIRAQFSGDMEALQRVLYGIEFNKPILFVDKIEVRTKRIRRIRRSGSGRTGTTAQCIIGSFGISRATRSLLSG